MNCQFEFCIYNKNLKCIVKNPEINAFGAYDSCIVVSIDKNLLDREKERQLFDLENR